MSDLSALAAGFYTVPEAARLIRVGNARRIYGWLRGYPARDAGPILARDFKPITEEEELSFLDLMEVRFVMFFRDHGVKVSSLRKASVELRKEFKTSHPFALSKVLLRADKADVYIVEMLRETARDTDDVRLRSLVTGNYVMHQIISQSILPGVEFDTATQLASSWRPIPDAFPDIVVDPKRAFGQPAIPRGIPTGTLFEAWKTEGQNADAVADWYGVTTRDVAEAVRFEQALDEFAAKRAA